MSSKRKHNARTKKSSVSADRWRFIAPELAQMAYALLTSLVILFTWTSLNDPQGLLFERVTMLSGTLALWLVYQLMPCRLLMLCRVVYLLLMLSSWYPDTYELNHQFGSWDNVFAEWEQQLFGYQPAYLFSKNWSSPIVSELMYFGYVSYYLFFVVTTFIIYKVDYSQLEHAMLILFGSFFLCYTIYLFLPVTGPQYYYLAIGEECVKNGNFPDIGTFFANTTECLPAPGWRDGLFYHLCQLAHQTGERPTAAFPSSHVAIATVVMLIVGKMRMWRWLGILSLPYILLCLSTVYIQAHYAIDAIAGLIWGMMLFFLFGGMKIRKV